jgi:hypothetical protein
MAHVERTVEGGRVAMPDGLILQTSSRDRWHAELRDMTTARVECSREARFERDRWMIRVTVDASLRCEADTFLLEQRVEAWENDVPVRRREWTQRILRRGV